MAFKKVKDYNEARFGKFFLLRNDGDFADVIFLYKSYDDVLEADVHYIKSTDYSGYVHCCGHGCPACGKNIKVQNKLFIPVYNIKEGEIQFWDRNMRFEAQLEHDVFSQFSNPSDYVFRVTRKGEAGSYDTTYQILVVGTVKGTSYDQILEENNATFPDYYDQICKDLSVEQLSAMLNNSPTTVDTNFTSVPNYTVTPRPVVNSFVPPAFTSTDSDEEVTSNNSFEELDDDVQF